MNINNLRRLADMGFLNQEYRSCMLEGYRTYYNLPETDFVEHFGIEETCLKQLADSYGLFGQSSLRVRSLILRLIKHGNWMPKFHLLEEAIKINQESELEFDIDQWVNVCGTTACFIGNYILGKPNCELSLEEVANPFVAPTIKEDTGILSDCSAVGLHFNISVTDASALFLRNNLYGNDKQDVINRVQKFIDCGKESVEMAWR